MSIKKNIESINKQISSTAVKSGYNPSDIIIVCVTKNRSVSEICEALDTGITHIGENKIQEAEEKYRLITEYAKNKNIPLSFHMVGHLQTNKVTKALDMFTMIQSVDSLRLALKINDLSKERNLTTDILIEVNVSKEASKFGLDTDEVIPFLREISALDSIRIRGLMTMAPLVEDKEKTRPYFHSLRQLRDKIDKIDELRFKNRLKIDFLSMGMSQDYEVAVQEGANMLRIGSAIFK